MMRKLLTFWLPLAAVAASWELVLWRPGWLWYWLILNLVGTGFFLVWLARGRILIDWLPLLVVNLGVFWWLLWLDFAALRYIFPLFFMPFVYKVLKESGQSDEALFTEQGQFLLVLGGTFFVSSTCFGLLTVLGWQLWPASFIFLIAFALLIYPGRAQLVDFLILCLLGIEAFAILAWLPFSELTLGVLLTIFVTASRDLLKYFISPDLIVARIIWKKAVFYLGLTAFVLIFSVWL